MPASAICEAIHSLLVLEFDYDERHRVVHPYLHGVTRPGHEALRAIQVGGQSRSRHFGEGKVWELAKVRNLKLTTTLFVPDDPHYNPDDSAFAQIHCRVSRLVTDARR